MAGIKESMTRHPVTAFFALTYLVSWPLFAVALFLLPGNMAIQGTLGSMAAFGPVIAGVIVSAATDRSPRLRQGRRRPAAFLASWLLSGLVLVLFMRRVRGIPLRPEFALFAGLLAFIPAYIISCAYSSRTGVRRYLSTLVAPRGNPAWYLVAFFTVPAVQLAGYAVTRLAGREVGVLIDGGAAAGTLAVIALTFLQGFLFAGGINEESGWRGFAIPKLQESHPPLVAAVVVWFFWALWHLPYDIASGGSVSGILFNRLVLNLVWSILFVWIFNRTRGSILAPAVFHPAMNTFGGILPRTHAATAFFLLLTLGVIIGDRMWQERSAGPGENAERGCGISRSRIPEQAPDRSREGQA